MSSFKRKNLSNLKSSQPQTQLIIDSFLNNTKINWNFILLEDSICQSGLPILKELINRTSEQKHTLLLITLNVDPEKLLSSTAFKKIENHDLYKTLDLSLSQADKSIKALDHIATRVEQLVQELLTVDVQKSTTVIIDSAHESIRRWSLHQTFKFYRSLVQFLSKSQSRLVVLDSPHLHPRPSSNDLLNGSTVLQSSTISSSHLHLKIHPTSLIDHLVNSFGIPLPHTSPQQTGTHYDLRFFPLLAELSVNCDPYSSPEEGRHVPTPQALLIPAGSDLPYLGSCIIEWVSKNVPASQFSPSVSIGSKLHSTPSSNGPSKMGAVQRGLEALKITNSSPNATNFRLSAVLLSSVVTQKAHKLVPDAAQESNLGSGLDPLQDKLTFNLSLTDKQRKARETVNLPFLPRRAGDGAVIEAPGEIYDGSFRDPNSKNKGGKILYEPDSADDMDDEEPDDEL